MIILSRKRHVIQEVSRKLEKPYQTQTTMSKDLANIVEKRQIGLLEQFAFTKDLFQTFLAGNQPFISLLASLGVAERRRT